MDLSKLVGTVGKMLAVAEELTPYAEMIPIPAVSMAAKVAEFAEDAASAALNAAAAGRAALSTTDLASLQTMLGDAQAKRKALQALIDAA